MKKTVIIDRQELSQLTRIIDFHNNKFWDLIKDVLEHSNLRDEIVITMETQ